MTKKDYIAEAITEYYGERCPEHMTGCPCCNAWAQYDAKEAADAALKEACRHIQALVGIRCIWSDPTHDITTKPARAFITKHGSQT